MTLPTDLTQLQRDYAVAVLIPNHTEEELTTFCFSTKRGLSPEAKIPSKKSPGQRPGLFVREALSSD